MSSVVSKIHESRLSLLLLSIIAACGAGCNREPHTIHIVREISANPDGCSQPVLTAVFKHTFSTDYHYLCRLPGERISFYYSVNVFGQYTKDVMSELDNEEKFELPQVNE